MLLIYLRVLLCAAAGRTCERRPKASTAPSLLRRHPVVLSVATEAPKSAGTGRSSGVSPVNTSLLSLRCFGRVSCVPTSCVGARRTSNLNWLLFSAFRTVSNGKRTRFEHGDAFGSSRVKREMMYTLGSRTVAESFFLFIFSLFIVAFWLVLVFVPLFRWKWPGSPLRELHLAGNYFWNSALYNTPCVGNHRCRFEPLSLSA